MFSSRVCRATVVLVAALSSASAEAAFHQWAIKEVFTSADGMHQFVEFFTTAPLEGSLDPHDVVITADGEAKTFPFDHDLANPTTNKHFLLATAGFGSLPGGVTPDFMPLAGNLFNPNAATIRIDFAHEYDVLTVSGTQIPKDGVNSLQDADTTYLGPDVLSTGLNSPTNFAGAAGSVNLGGGMPIAGDFNGDDMVNGADLAVWRGNFGASGAPTASQGNADADADVDGRDFLVWQRNVGATSSAAAASIPEPAGAALFHAVMAAIVLRRSTRRR